MKCSGSNQKVPVSQHVGQGIKYHSWKTPCPQCGKKVGGKVVEDWSMVILAPHKTP